MRHKNKYFQGYKFWKVVAVGALGRWEQQEAAVCICEEVAEQRVDLDPSVSHTLRQNYLENRLGKEVALPCLPDQPSQLERQS